MTPTRAITAISLVLALSGAAPAKDLVPSLPSAPALRSAHYSGFLSAGGDKKTAYYFVACEKSPWTSCPVVVWLNGGPPCSSKIGLFLENGPISMDIDGNLTENIGRWSIAANVLYFESPVGVGYSYRASTAPPYAADDNTTAQDNLNTLISFYAAFPELGAADGAADLWITGESYAGVYVPMFAAAVLASNQTAIKDVLKGVMVGNGAIATGDWYEAGLVKQRMDHAFTHGLFSPVLKASIDAACNWTARSPACNTLLDEVATEMGPLNSYNIEVTCASSGPGAHSLRTLLTGTMDPFGPFDAPNPCSAADEALTAYLNRADVVAAMHMEAGRAVMGSWGECAGGSAVNYRRLAQDETKSVYPALLAQIDVIIYNGDQDECIPYTQDITWTAAMGFSVKAQWQPWFVNDEVAGYSVEYASPVRFTFVSVKRAGHEVPMYQPLRALAMLERVLGGQAL